MADYGHEWTDKRLDVMERKIRKLYGETLEEAKERLKGILDTFADDDKKYAEMVEAGTMKKRAYKAWREETLGKAKHLQDMIDILATDFTNADKIAMKIVGEEALDVYATNANYAAFAIEKNMDVNLSWTLYDRSTVERLIRDDPDILPLPSVDIPLDMRWNRQHINSAITKGILLGDPIPEIAQRLVTVANMGMNAAIRNARTATTAAECAGRQDTYQRAKGMGIQLKKQWLATLDGKTRHAHRMLDGQTVDVEESFQVDGYKLKCPGDPSAPGYLIYNCRCTMISVDKFHDPNAPRMAENPLSGKSEIIQGMTYTEWETMHKEKNPEAWELYQKKSQNMGLDKKQYAEFKTVLGKNAPKSLDVFQHIKYNEHERWEELKKIKRQTSFVNNAPCETTPKKFSEYLLKPNAKHSNDFFDVGYTQDNPLQLRYDVAKEFDESKAFQKITRNDGAETFNMFMELGVSKKRTFLTGWIKDHPDSKPRIVTGFRKNRSEKDDK